MIRRPGYALAALAVFLIEAAIALWVHDAMVRPHGGDVLAVILVYLALRAVTPAGVRASAAIALAFAFAVEAAQWIGLAAMLGLRPHGVGETMLGSSFDTGDLIAYCLGVIAILVVEKLRARRS
ncbi:DUF2809 domain-containing protein [Sphingomonas sp.]|uniref:ribosomal maturation YjgA family protein n=1 Tax=Sphingomonas sp. TaxID=28214 RepID=UPI003F811A8D